MNRSFDVVIVANGSSLRMGFDKLSAFLGETTVLRRTINCFLGHPNLQKIIVVTDKEIDCVPAMRVKGGKTRSESVLCGLKEVTAPYVLIHDGARPFLTYELLDRTVQEVFLYRSAVPVVKVRDTVVWVDDHRSKTVDRERLRFCQTPQAFCTEEIKKAYELSQESATDDGTLYNLHIAPVHFFEGDPANKKITTPEDLFGINTLFGIGFDVHKLVPNRPLRLGGVTVPFSLGEEAHSDGDVVIHALADALLTACRLPDIGHLFPDTDEKYKNIDSCILLAEVAKRVKLQNRIILSIDICILLQAPKVAPFLMKMREKLSTILEISAENVNISATTTETLGIIGNSQGVASLAICNLQ